jgi:hypothetical protein
LLVVVGVRLDGILVVMVVEVVVLDLKVLVEQEVALLEMVDIE